MNNDLQYKAFQYTNSGFRMVVEVATPCTLREMIRRVMHEFATIGLNKYPNWEPIEDGDVRIMEMPKNPFCTGDCNNKFCKCGQKPCAYCPRTAEDDCDDDCHCDRCLNSPHLCRDCENRKVEEEGDSCNTCSKENVRIGKLEALQDEEMYGGDPNDPATWHGSKPDVQRWGDQI